jgi:hypothetical protein
MRSLLLTTLLLFLMPVVHGDARATDSLYSPSLNLTYRIIDETYTFELVPLYKVSEIHTLDSHSLGSTDNHQAHDSNWNCF